MASDPLSSLVTGNGPVAGSRVTATLRRLAGFGQLAEAGIVAGGIVVLAVVLAPLAWLLGGPAGLVALALAAGASLLAALLAVLVGRLFRGPKAPMYAMVAGMLIRMSVVLAVALTLKRGVPELAGGALIFFLLIFYLVALAIETALVIAKIRPDRTQIGTTGSDRSSPALPKVV